MPAHPTQRKADPLRICFLFNAQRHQLLHGVSIAAALARQDDIEVTILSPSPGHIAYARELVQRLGGGPILYRTASSLPLRASQRVTGGVVPPKLLTLMRFAPLLNGYDAIALPERTSIALRCQSASKRAPL